MRKVSENKEKHFLSKNDLEEFSKGLNNTVQVFDAAITACEELFDDN